MTYQSLWLQSVLGLSAIQAGLVFLPCAASVFLVAGQIGRFLHRTSPRWMVGIGLSVIAAGALAQAVVRTNSSWPVVIPGLVLVGIGAGLAMAALTSTAMGAVPWQRAGMAGGALNAFRQLGYAFGIAVLGEVFRSGLTRTAGPSLSAALSGGQAQAVMARTPALTPVVHRAFANGLDLAYLVAAGIGLVGAVAVFVLARPRPRPAVPAGADPAPETVEA
jgi:fucose permease